jgi:hypothetical protein
MQKLGRVRSLKDGLLDGFFLLPRVPELKDRTGLFEER